MEFNVLELEPEAHFCDFHGGSLSQLWVIIDEINQITGESHPWYAVRGPGQFTRSGVVALLRDNRQYEYFLP